MTDHRAMVVFSPTLLQVAPYDPSGCCDITSDHRRQLRVVGTLAAINVTELIVFGSIGWL